MSQILGETWKDTTTFWIIRPLDNRRHDVRSDPYISFFLSCHQDAPPRLFFVCFSCRFLILVCSATQNVVRHQAVCRCAYPLSSVPEHTPIASDVFRRGLVLSIPSHPHQGRIADNKIVVFSKSYCPYCRETKQYFASKYPSETVAVVECV